MFVRTNCIYLFLLLTADTHSEAIESNYIQSNTCSTLEEPQESDSHEITLRIPGTTVLCTLVETPGSRKDTADDGQEPIAPLLVLSTEVTWDLYDIYLYGLDEVDADDQSAAVSKPSKPYVPPDRGFGHEGYPAIGMTYKAAEKFCDWLSHKLGVETRLPTREEWIHLSCTTNSEEYCCGIDADSLGDFAWFVDNSEHSTHPVGLKKPNSYGLFDMFGNAAEWIQTDSRKPIAIGGGFRDSAQDCTARSTQKQVRSWNQSDPQIPKSQWWLADCSWVGFRFVIERTESNIQKLTEIEHESSESQEE